MTHRLYTDDAEWFEWLTVPADYASEAPVYRDALIAHAERPVREVLELGSGGGNNAVHLKAHFDMTLVDLSPEMVAIGRRRNPGCAHHQGDMRDVRLGRTFDAVFVHDAICYMTSPADLQAAAQTAFAHLRPGGAALFVPKFVRETYEARTRHGGHDAPDGRGVRWLHWSADADPSGHSYTVVLTCVFRERDGSYRVETEEHENGLFARLEWERTLSEAGFEQPQLSEAVGATLVVARRPGGET